MKESPWALMRKAEPELYDEVAGLSIPHAERRIREHFGIGSDVTPDVMYERVIAEMKSKLEKADA